MSQVLNNKNGGFTIIEMVVVMAVFLFIIGAAMGVFISIVQGQRRVFAEQQFLNQISYIEEYMSKALRMAKADPDGSCLVESGLIYKLTRQNTGLGTFNGIKFINQSDGDVCQEFFLDNSTNPENPVLKELKNSNKDSDAVALTSSNLKINFIKFVIDRLEENTSVAQCTKGNQCAQPRITILLKATIPMGVDEIDRTIQTTVSRRNLNVLQ